MTALHVSLGLPISNSNEIIPATILSAEKIVKHPTALMVCMCATKQLIINFDDL
jgi:hypothetical protein